jgi:hypothetical protein
MKFSQRIGKTKAEKLVQYEDIDVDLKNGLWNAFTITFLERVSYSPRDSSYTKRSNLNSMIINLWLHHFKHPVDKIPLYFSDTKATLRKWFFEAKWFQIFDFIEACVDYGYEYQGRIDEFIKLCNFHLERENSAYRFVSRELSEITSAEEIEEVEAAISHSGIYAGVKEHLSSSLTLMNDRENPDYRNSIKESISAVESLAKVLSGDDKATLGQALKTIEKNGKLHSALKSAFSSLYGYTSDAEGIRHSLLDESSLTKTDARFMLVSRSAFVNYLIEINGE